MTINALGIIPGKTDGCPRMGDYAIKKKMTVKWGKQKKGDIVLFDFNHNGTSDHIGLVVAVNSNGSITTIEGNTGSGNNTNGGQVQMRTRYKSEVNYFARPKYTKEVTADMVIATAKAELGITESPAGSNKVKYNRWFYGSNISAFWCCTFVCWLFAHVLTKEDLKPIPGTYTGAWPTKMIQKGSKGENVIRWQKFLKWMGYSLDADGDFGKHTKKITKKAQKKFGFKGKSVDGVVGPKTIAAAKKYKKPVATKKTQTTTSAAKQVQATPTNAQKLINKAKDLAWAYGTATKKYDYKTGNPKAVCKTAMKKYGWADDRAEMSDCGNALSTIVRASGVDKSFTALHGVKTAFPKTEKAFNIVHTGEIKNFTLKPGDLVRYKKNNGKQHALMIFGDGKVCEASHHNFFLVIRKDTKRYNSQAKKSTIQVLRAKE